MIFEKHRVLEIVKHVDFNMKTNHILDAYDFQWNPHCYDLFEKYIPIAAKLITD